MALCTHQITTSVDANNSPETERPRPADVERSLPVQVFTTLFKLVLLFIFGPMAVSLVLQVVSQPFITLMAPRVAHFGVSLGDGGKFWGAPQDAVQAVVLLANFRSYLQA